MAQVAPSNGTVLLMTKWPEPGRVKTRMSPPLTPAQAARLSVCLLEDALEATEAIAEGLGLSVTVCLDPEDAIPAARALMPPSFQIQAQRGHGLAERMAYAVEEAFKAGAPRVFLRGSDTPMLSAAHFKQSLQALGHADVVVSPCEDGGYGLLGLNRCWPGLFNLEMSTSRVCEETLQRAKELGARSVEGMPCFDLDTEEDLRTLFWLRNTPERALCLRTLAFLEAQELWPPA